jgi:hypothetical protein
MCLEKAELTDRTIRGVGTLSRGRMDALEEAQEDSLHHDDMVQDFVQVLVTQRFRMGLYGLQQGFICPFLVAKEGTKQIYHGAQQPP